MPLVWPYSYQLSTDLEGTVDLLPPPSPTPSKIPQSPSRMRQRFKTLFGSKGAVISDSHTLTPPRSHTLTPPRSHSLTPSRSHSLTPTLPSLPTHHSPVTKILSDSASMDNLDQLDVEIQRTHLTRSNSMSPSIGRRYCDTDTKPRPHRGHVIRVALTHSDHCNYTCLLVS